MLQACLKWLQFISADKTGCGNDGEGLGPAGLDSILALPHSNPISEQGACARASVGRCLTKASAFSPQTTSEPPPSSIKTQHLVRKERLRDTVRTESNQRVWRTRLSCTLRSSDWHCLSEDSCLLVAFSHRTS